GMIQLDSQAKALIESVAALRAQIVAKEVQIKSLSLSETPSNPDILMAREQLSALQSQLRQLGGTQSGEDSDLIVPRGKIPEAGMEYVRKLRDVKYNELIFELLAKEFKNQLVIFHVAQLANVLHSRLGNFTPGNNQVRIFTGLRSAELP